MKLFVSITLIAALCVPTWAGTARVEGQIADLDGRPAAGYRIHAAAIEGDARYSAVADDSGVYSLRDLDRGRYRLAVETPAGEFAPVQAEFALEDSQLARRDIKLVGQDPNNPAVAKNDYSFGTWWAGLSGGAKAWTIIAMVVVVGVSAEALESKEGTASEFVPPTR